MSAKRLSSNNAPVAGPPAETICQEGQEVIAGSSLEDTGQASDSTSSNRSTNSIHPTRTHSQARVPEADGSSALSPSSQADTGLVNPTQRNPSVLQSWILELLALMVSLISFGAITAILFKYHHKVQPEFTYDININTLIAILSTILRATLLYTLSQVIGQAKWAWMAESSRPLRDVERFDEAGKGAWGSLKFFSPKRNHTPTLVGSFVVIASYAIGPFSQQASSTYPCDQVVGDAKLLIAAHVGEDDRYREHIRTGYEVPPDMAAAVMTGMRYGKTNISLSISNLFECKSGNCTFPTMTGITHTSIGMCNTCTDITEAMGKINKEENGTDYFTTHPGSIPVTWPVRTKEYRNHDSIGLSLTCIPDNTTQEARWEAKTTITTFTANGCTDNTSSSGLIERQCDRKFGSISHTDGKPPGRDVSVLAANCSLHQCLRHYSSEVINGVLNEKLVSSEKIPLDDEDRLVYEMTEPCLIDGKWYFASNISQAPLEEGMEIPWGVDADFPFPRVCTRWLESETISMIESFINETISGSCWYQWAGLRYQTTDGLRPGPVRPNEVLELIKCDKWWLEPLYNNGNATLETVSASLDIMATIITNYMRATSGEYVNGSATSSFICIRADWLWLTYPGVLMILTAYLLMDEIIRCCRDHSKNPVWKSAILPLLFYNVEPKLGRTGPNVKANMGETLPLLDLTQLEKLADGMAVRFVKDRDSPGFVIEEKAEIGTEKKWSRSQEA